MRDTRPLTRTAVLTALVAGVLATSAAAQPLDRTPARYHILARKFAHLKDYHLRGSGGSCNIGVNDAAGALQTNGTGPTVFQMDVGQIVAADCSSASGKVEQCFCNSSEGFDEVCAGWPTALLADETDATFIAACNDGLSQGDFPAAFVTGAQDVTCQLGTDCVPAAVDTVPGNAKCDLAPGAYRLVHPKEECTIVFRGVYDVADYTAGKRVKIEVADPSTLNVAGETSELLLGDAGEVENQCGRFRINYRGPAQASKRIVNLGRANQGIVTLDVCAPFALIRLRNKNMLRGHFFADAVQGDFNNEGECCGGSASCGCFEAAAPAALPVGAQLTLTGGCDLGNITQVKVCGVDCPIVLPRVPDQIVCTVPSPGAVPQSCIVEGVSSSGVFVGNTAVTVTP